eukprot:gene10049-2368_t
MIISQGTFCCDSFGKKTVGSVKMLKENNSTKTPAQQKLWYRFEGYHASDGPLVYGYATNTASSQSITGGIRIQPQTLTQRGSFDIEVSMSSDIFKNPLNYKGITIWCDQFGVYFGSAGLSKVENSTLAGNLSSNAISEKIVGFKGTFWKETFKALFTRTKSTQHKSTECEDTTEKFRETFNFIPPTVQETILKNAVKNLSKRVPSIPTKTFEKLVNNFADSSVPEEEKCHKNV